MGDPDCGKIATLHPDEVVVPQPQGARTLRFVIPDAADKLLKNELLTDITPDRLKLAGPLLSLKWLSQPPSERS